MQKNKKESNKRLRRPVHGSTQTQKKEKRKGEEMAEREGRAGRARQGRARQDGREKL